MSEGSRKQRGTDGDDRVYRHCLSSGDVQINSEDWGTFIYKMVITGLRTQKCTEKGQKDGTLR